MSRLGGGASANAVTIVGGGIAGLTAAIACAEGGAKVSLLEAHHELGGRARSSEGPYKANFGPHVLYKDGPFWGWMAERSLLPAYAGLPLAGVKLRLGGAIRRIPPLGAIPSVLRLRGREAPVELDFRTWAEHHTDERTAAMLSAAAGVYTFHHDPGALSAAFVWSRTVRTLLSPPPVARYAIGGWTSLVASLERRARELGVEIRTGHSAEELPDPPVILATELAQASSLLAEDSLSWTSGHTVCLDVGLRHRRGDPFVVSDMDEAGWIERFSAADASLAPKGEELVQAQMPVRPEESVEQAASRLERLMDASLPGWQERVTWRRRQVMDARTGALDLPGSSWRDRPAVDRGDGVFLAGDMVAAPGLLSEVSWASAIEASRLALEALGTTRPRLREVA
jgi:phytoene dehydrogenase-like protein